MLAWTHNTLIYLNVENTQLSKNMSSEIIIPERTLEEEFAVALNVVFASSLTKKQEQETSKDVLSFWKEHVNPGNFTSQRWIWCFISMMISYVCFFSNWFKDSCNIVSLSRKHQPQTTLRKNKKILLLLNGETVRYVDCDLGVDRFSDFSHISLIHLIGRRLWI